MFQNRHQSAGKSKLQILHITQHNIEHGKECWLCANTPTVVAKTTSQLLSESVW